MKYHEFNASATKPKRRVGRGIAAGQGKTAGRGTKGQGARTGSSARPGFAGGQNPLMQLLPKLRGFKSHHAKLENVYTGDIAKLGAVVDNQKLADAGLVSSAYVSIKLLKRGDLGGKVTVKLQAASASAVEAVEAAGGSFEKTVRLSRPKTSTKKSAQN